MNEWFPILQIILVYWFWLLTHVWMWWHARLVLRSWFSKLLIKVINLKHYLILFRYRMLRNWSSKTNCWKFWHTWCRCISVVCSKCCGGGDMPDWFLVHDWIWNRKDVILVSIYTKSITIIMRQVKTVTLKFLSIWKNKYLLLIFIRGPCMLFEA